MLGARPRMMDQLMPSVRVSLLSSGFSAKEAPDDRGRSFTGGFSVRSVGWRVSSSDCTDALLPQLQAGPMISWCCCIQSGVVCCHMKARMNNRPIHLTYVNTVSCKGCARNNNVLVVPSRLQVREAVRLSTRGGLEVKAFTISSWVPTLTNFASRGNRFPCVVLEGERTSFLSTIFSYRWAVLQRDRWCSWPCGKILSIRRVFSLAAPQFIRPITYLTSSVSPSRCRGNFSRKNNLQNTTGFCRRTFCQPWCLHFSDGREVHTDYILCLPIILVEGANPFARRVIWARGSVFHHSLLYVRQT